MYLRKLCGIKQAGILKGNAFWNTTFSSSQQHNFPSCHVWCLIYGVMSPPTGDNTKHQFSFTICFIILALICEQGKYHEYYTCPGDFGNLQILFMQAVCCVRWFPVAPRRWMRPLKAPAELIWSGESCRAWRGPGWCSRPLALSG